MDNYFDFGRSAHVYTWVYGMTFDEITASSLIKVNLDGNKVMDSPPHEINPAGFTIHSAIHAAREDAHCVLHVHSVNGCASRSAAILYGKDPHFGLISGGMDGSLRPHAVYGALSWRATGNARHVSNRAGKLHAINRVLIRGVLMACNTPNSRLERARRLLHTLPDGQGQIAGPIKRVGHDALVGS